GRLAAIKDGLLESVAVCEEHLIWENGHLDTWKMVLFNDNPEKTIESKLLSILCNMTPAVDEHAHDDVFCSDAFLFSKAELDRGSSVKDRKSSYFTVDEYASIVPRSRQATLDTIPNYAGCATWDVDSDDELQVTPDVDHNL